MAGVRPHAPDKDRASLVGQGADARPDSLLDPFALLDIGAKSSLADVILRHGRGTGGLAEDGVYHRDTPAAHPWDLTVLEHHVHETSHSSQVGE